MTRLWLLAGAAAMFSPAGDAAAQTAKEKSPPPAHVDSTSTMKGVYTTAQAGRGRNTYLGNCRSCHTPESHTGATFNATWDRRSLSELYAFIRERMPKNDPGTLSEEEYADVLAYLLKMNGMPAGQVELPPDTTALKRIRIDLPKSP